MRRVYVLLAVILALVWQNAGRTADLIEQVPANAPAYLQLRQLAQHDMLMSGRDVLIRSSTRTLTKYDFALLLSEPLKRFIALAEPVDNLGTDPGQKRLRELASLAAGKMTAAEFDGLLTATTQLLRTFKDVIEELAPGLPARATEALLKLRQPEHRPWLKPLAAITTDDNTRGISISFNPSKNPESGPLPWFIPSTDPMRDLPMLSGGKLPDAGPALISTKPVNAMEVAVRMAFNRFQLYGTVAALPGQDILNALKADGTGRAIIGVTWNIGHFRDLDVSSMFEYHRWSTGAPGNTDVTTGTALGIGVKWD
ncbi:MAG: hypothetical protein ACYDBB_03110 [Armatimonadota bacterium]